MVLPPRLRRHSASAALAVGAVFFSALKEAIEPVQPVEPVEPMEQVNALADPVLAEGQEAVHVEVQEGSVALKQAVQVEVELGAQA